MGAKNAKAGAPKYDFEQDELSMLKDLFHDLAKRDEAPEIDKTTFLEFFAVPPILGERLFQVFDNKQTGVIDLTEFLDGLATYAHGSSESKMQALFNIYDLNEEKAISKEELEMILFSLVQNDGTLEEEHVMNRFDSDDSVPAFKLMPGMDSRAALKKMIDDAFEECDTDKSGKLSREQWRLFVERHPALVHNLEYVLIGRVWDSLHPEKIGLAITMADEDEFDHRFSLRSENKRIGLTLNIENQGTLSHHSCKSSKVDLWTGGTPPAIDENPETTQVSFHFHGNCKYTAKDLKFCPFTGEPLEHQGEFSMEQVKTEFRTPRKAGKLRKTGYIFQKKSFSSMKKRFAAVSGHFLYFFPKEDMAMESRESVSYILGFFVEPLRRTEKGKLGIKLVPPAGSRMKAFTLYIEGEHERKDWINALRKAARTEDIHDVYSLDESIGSGQFSVVYRAQNKHTGELVAVKQIDKSHLDAKQRESIQTEIAICQLVSHPYVITLKEVFETQSEMYLVMPLSNGDLFSYLKSKKRIEEPMSKRIIWNLLDALKYIHALGIVHRDLKPENILMKDPETDPTHIIIADFGLSKFAMPHERLQMAVGTIAYVAPEVLQKGGYDKKCDLWSVGCIMYVILRGKLPFDAARKQDIIRKTLLRPAKLDDEKWKIISNPAKNLISKLLKKNPDNRIDLKTAMNHTWFDDIRPKKPAV